jgi:hypothetical protein
MNNCSTLSLIFSRTSVHQRSPNFGHLIATLTFGWPSDGKLVGLMELGAQVDAS